MKEKETATIGCAVWLCGLISPWCKLASIMLSKLHVYYTNGRGEEGGRKGTRGRW